MTTIPVIRGHLATSNSGTAPVPVNIPTDSTAPIVGDLMVVVIVFTSASTVSSIPAGWSQVLAPTAMGSRYIAVYRSTRAAGDPNQVTFTLNAAGTALATVYYGAAVYGGIGAYLRTTTGNVQTTPGVTTTVANSLAISIQGEATSATETTSNITVSSPFTKDAWDIHSSSPINSILLAHRDMAAAGATGDAVSTWLKSDGTANSSGNRGSIMMIWEPVADVAPPPITKYPVTVSDGAGNAIAGKATLWMGAEIGEVAIAKIEAVHSGTSVPDLDRIDRVWWMAHRGGSADYQEHSKRGYVQSAVAHADVLEFSVAITSDKRFIGAHDGTADRTSSSVNGQAWRFDQHTLAEVQALTQDLPNRGDTRFTTAPYVTVEEFIAQWAGTHTLMFDLKEVGTADRRLFYAIVQQIPNYRDWVLGKFYTTGTAIADEFHAIGCKAWGYSYTADLGALEPLSSSPDGTEAGRRFIVRTDAQSALATAPKWDYLGLEWNADPRAWAAMVNLAGSKRIIGHICPNAAAARQAVARGARALQVSGVNSVSAAY